MIIKVAFRKFLTEDDGTITVEFAILLSAILMLITTFVAVSINVATASDVQQAAHDLTRQSLRYIDTGMSAQEICAGLHSDVLDSVAAKLTFVELHRIESLSCTLDAERTAGTVTIAYSIEGTFLERAAGLFGVAFDGIERSARIML